MDRVRRLLPPLGYLPIILMMLAALILCNCQPATIATVGVTAIQEVPKYFKEPTEVASLPPHDVWCYQTLGYPECYPHAQPVEPERLINVEPQDKYPLTRDDYAKKLAESQEIPVVKTP